MEQHQIILADLDAWDAFVEHNRDALIETYASVDEAYRHAVQGGLTLGGGASPLVFVSFADWK